MRSKLYGQLHGNYMLKIKMKTTKISGWLVMAAALLFAGCSSEDGVIEEQTPQQPQQTAATIHVTVGAGISDGEGATRSTVVKDGSTRTLQFTTGDRLYVWGQKNKIYDQFDNYYCEYVVAGTLELVAIDPEDPTKATFSGDLSVYRAEVQGDYDGGVLTLYGVTYPDGNLVSDLSAFLQSDDPLGEFENVKATLIHEDAAEDVDYVISEDDRIVYYWPDCAATVEELMTTELWVSGEYDSGTKSFALEKDTDQPIVNCTISGLEAGVSYKVDYIYGTTAAMSDHSRMLYSSMEATAGTLAFAFIAATGDNFHGIRLTNTADAGDTYTVSIGQKEFESKVYNLSRRFVNLASVTTETDGYGYEYFAAKNGDVLSGDFSSNNGYGYVTIPDGATVTLNGVTFINGSIHCNGAATINLEGTNTIECECDLGILIESGTLTIQGSGSLTATGGAGTAGIGGYDIANLVIKSGYITAQGGIDGAGIGSVPGGEFGTITIEGGNVTATGGDNAAGIGSGQAGSSCGNIVIGSDITKVVATKRGNSSAHIGASANGSCGTLTIDGVENATTSSTFPHLTSTVSSNTWTLTNPSN